MIAKVIDYTAANTTVEAISPGKKTVISHKN